MTDGKTQRARVKPKDKPDKPKDKPDKPKVRKEIPFLAFAHWTAWGIFLVVLVFLWSDIPRDPKMADYVKVTAQMVFVFLFAFGLNRLLGGR